MIRTSTNNEFIITTSRFALIAKKEFTFEFQIKRVFATPTVIPAAANNYRVLAIHQMSRKIFFSAIKRTNKIRFLSKHVLKFILTKVVTKWVAKISSIELKTCIEDTVVKAKHSVQELQKAQTKNDSIFWIEY